MAMLLRSLLPLLCVLAIPGTLGRHILGQDASGFTGRVRKTTKSQKSRIGGTEVRQPHLAFRQSPPQSMSASEFGSAVLECEAGGNPPPTIHWLKDGNRVTVGTKDLNQEARDEEAEVDAPLGMSLTRSRLYLDCLVSGDEATYSCVAENPYLRIATDTKLTVRPPQLSTDENGATTSELCLSKKAFGSPARIHMWTHSRLEIQGSGAQLFCRTVGIPQPSVIWIGPDERPITSGGKYQVLPSGDLVIRDLVWEDQGSYLCLAENEKGTDKTSTFLYPAARERREKN